MIGHEEFLKVIKLLEDNYGRELPDSTVRIWYDEFKNETIENFKYAVIECIKENRFFPTINEVKEEIRNKKNRDWHKENDKPGTVSLYNPY